MDEFSRNWSGSSPENWNFQKKFGGIFHKTVWASNWKTGIFEKYLDEFSWTEIGSEIVTIEFKEELDHLDGSRFSHQF